MAILHLFSLNFHISPRRGRVRLRGDQEPDLMSDVNTSASSLGARHSFYQELEHPNVKGEQCFTVKQC